jgi:hypothetical protein
VADEMKVDGTIQFVPFLFRLLNIIFPERPLPMLQGFAHEGGGDRFGNGDQLDIFRISPATERAAGDRFPDPLEIFGNHDQVVPAI